VGDADGDGEGDAWIYAYHWDTGGQTGVANDPDGSYDLGLKGGLWTLGVEPTHANVDWYFDPDVGEQWVWFPYTKTLEVWKTVSFTVTRAEYFHVTGWVDDPHGDPPPAGTAGVDLCNDEGRCFGAKVEASGRFTVPVLPGTYQVWVWVDPDTGLLPPLNDGFSVFVEADLDLGVLRLRAPADRSATVSGRVIITPTGQGAVGVAMEAWTDEGDWASTTTITEGNYVLELFPGHWHAGPVLSPWQEENFVVLAPQHQHGYLEANQVISDVNFYLRYRDATIQGRVVDEADEVITDPTLSAVAFAEYCPPNPDMPCWIVDEEEVQGGSFELRVVGGLSYTVGIWLQSPGYMPGPPEDVHVGIGETKTGVRLILIEAGTRIWGFLRSNDPEDPFPQIEASIYGSAPVYDSNLKDQYWVEDSLWPSKDPYWFNLYVPTPMTERITWTLGLWVDPSTGYIADPAYPRYKVGIDPGRDDPVASDMYVMKLDTIISGTVWLGPIGGTPAPYIWVFAKGVKGTDSAGLYFEAETDENGEFSMYVLPGEYEVRAYLPSHLADSYLAPPPVVWDSVDDNPVDLAFRSRAGQEVEISGGLSVYPAGSVASDAHIFVLGWTDEDIVSVVTGTLANGYHLPVISNTTWHVWAAYEDLENNAFYYTPKVIDVDVGELPVSGINLVLVREDFELPDTKCWTFDPTRFKRLSLPAWGNLPEPLIEIQANTMPVEGSVKVCATPRVAVPGGPRMVGFTYEIEAWDSRGDLITDEFNKKVRLIFYLSSTVLPAGSHLEDLEVVYYSTVRQEWVSLDDVFIDPEDWFATGKINHFSRFGVRSPTTGLEEIYLPLVVRSFEG
jgi:hypothetical protein